MIKFDNGRLLVFLQRTPGESFYDRSQEILVSVFGKVPICGVTVESVSETSLVLQLPLIRGTALAPSPSL
jgi:hypothetical protein